MKTSTIRGKKVKAWMIVNRYRRDDIYAAYPSKEEARHHINETKAFFRKDVLRLCIISYTLPKKK